MPKSYSLQIDKSPTFLDNALKYPRRIQMSHDADKVPELEKETFFLPLIHFLWKPALLFVVLFWVFMHFLTPIKIYPNGRPVPEQAPDKPAPPHSVT
ncbi:MAG: hypothetical protein AAB351_00575 [Patescibacteria group bacterium]